MNLRSATFAATRWTTVSAVARTGLQLLQTMLLARLLAPADFGLMAMAGVVMSLTMLFSDLGLSSALMHYAQPDRCTLSTLYWLNLAAACILALLFAVIGWPLSTIYGQPKLVAITSWLALSLPLAALGQQFRVLAEKNLNFKPLAQNEIISAFIGFSVALTTAMLDWGIYAIVASQLFMSATNSGLAWARLSNQIRPQALFHWPLARPFFAFGLHRMGDSFWNTALTQSDIFIAGVFTTPHAVAIYAVPRDQSLKIANTIINPVITRVGLPVMTRLRGEPVALQTVYLKTLRLTASFNFPIYALLALFAEPIVSLLLGDQWHEASTYLRLFAVWGLIRSTGNPAGILLYAVGMAQRAHLWNFLLFALTAPLFWFVMQYAGLLALAWAMVISMAGIYILAWRLLIYPACGVSFKKYSAVFFAPLITTSLATAITYAATSVIEPSWQVPLGIMFFLIAYWGSSIWLNTEWINTLSELLTPLKRYLK